MKGTIFDFLKLVAEKPDLTKDLVALAAKYDFEFSDEVSDEELDAVAGGGTVKTVMMSLTGGGMPDGMVDPTGGLPTSSPPGVPTPYPNVAGDGSTGGDPINTGGVTLPTGKVSSSSGDQAG